MPVIERLRVDEEKLRALCAAWQVRELSVFGSALRDDFGEGSDVDLLVTFAPGVRWRLRELMDLEDELAALFGRQIDLVEREAVEESPNYIRRRAILSSLETVYAAG
jgi:uncharacterized protein